MYKGKGIEILRNQNLAFSYDIQTNRFYFFGIGLGEELTKATEILGDPNKSVKMKTKEKYSYILLDHATYSSITATFTTKDDVIISIKFEFQRDDEQRLIQEGISNFEDKVYRLNNEPNNDAFVFKSRNGEELIEPCLYSDELGITLQYVLQENNKEIKLNKLLDEKFSLSSMESYLVSSYNLK